MNSKGYWVSRAAAFLGVVALFATLATVIFANQSNTFSPTTGTVSGLALTTNYNNAFSALQSCNSGAGAPSNDQTAAPVQGQCWLNTSTTPFTLQQFDGTSWITLGWMDATNHQWVPNVAGIPGTVASASTTDLCRVGGVLTPAPTISVTGNATINGFGSSCPVGTIKLVTFAGTPTLVNSAALTLPNAGFNINANVGDSVAVAETSSGVWQAVFYQQASGLGGIPSGTEAAFAGVTPPSGWTLEAGQAISRSGNAPLFNVLTTSVTGTPGSGSATINSVSVDLRNLGVEGALLEGTGISLGAFISSVTASTIVMNTTATGGSGGEPIRILPWGQGDGSTTFNVPDRRGVVLAGRDNMGGTAAGRLSLAQSQGILGTKFGAGVAGGNIGGEQSHTQLLAEIASHSHTITDPGHFHYQFNTDSNTGSVLTTNNTNFPIWLHADPNDYEIFGTTTTPTIGPTTTTTTGITGTNASGSGTAMNQVQPTAITNLMIKN